MEDPKDSPLLSPLETFSFHKASEFEMAVKMARVAGTCVVVVVE